MYVLGVVGPDAADLLARLATRLDGRVATVESLGPEAADHDDAAAASFGLAEGGSWVAAGEGRSLPELLDDLAPRFDYALVAGFPDADVPTVVVGDPDADVNDPIERAPDAASVDVEAVVEGLHASEPRITLPELVARIKRSPGADRAGAIATFTGRVRAKDAPDDPRTTHLEFEKYEGVAEERLATLREELEAREGVQAVLLHHRTGVVPDGEDIVFVVVLAGHREEAFRTVEDGINRLKDEVPIFKKETTVEEQFWVHDRS